MKYNIYVGIPAYDLHYIGTYECRDQGEAEDLAWELACEEYEQYAGLHGIPSWDECREEIYDLYSAEIEAEEYTEDDIEAMTDDQYNEEIASWADYRAILESEDKEFYKSYSDSDKHYF